MFFFRRTIVKAGKIGCVLGQSDYGREIGPFSRVKVTSMLNTLESILTRNQTKYPELEKVTLDILFGFGDYLDRGGNVWLEHFATFQGSLISRLSAPGAYAAYIKNVVGLPAESWVYAQELLDLQHKHFRAYQDLIRIQNNCIEAYRYYMGLPATQAFFEKNTLVAMLVWLNWSSRAESKSSAPKDIRKIRAIGSQNLETLLRVYIRRIMGVYGLVQLSKLYPEVKASLPLLYQQSGVFREIVLKTIYAIATSHYKLLWENVSGHVPSSDEISQLSVEYHQQDLTHPVADRYVLAHLISCSNEILEVLALCLPSQNFEKTNHQQPNERAMALIAAQIPHDPLFAAIHTELIQDILPIFEKLDEEITKFRKNSPDADPEIIAVYLRACVVVMEGPIAMREMRAIPTDILAKRMIAEVLPEVADNDKEWTHLPSIFLDR